jgi:hypothetical protein
VRGKKAAECIVPFAAKHSVAPQKVNAGRAFSVNRPSRTFRNVVRGAAIRA